RVGSRSGFFALAGYIGVLGPAENRKPAPGEGTGGEERQKIAMTAPVITETSATAAADGDFAAGGGAAAGEAASAAETGGVAAGADGGGWGAGEGGGSGEPQKIAMTAPVVTEVVTPVAGETGAGESTTAASKTTMQFLLPASFTPENTPIPTNPDVRVRQVPARLIGALTFSGLTTNAVLEHKSQELRSALEKAGYGIAGKYVLARYNDPFTIPWFRTNEILYPLEEVRKESGL
ncbi:unnamed protein product, partial [Closterium sp. NIES-53]